MTYVISREGIVQHGVRAGRAKGGVSLNFTLGFDTEAQYDTGSC